MDIVYGNLKYTGQEKGSVELPFNTVQEAREQVAVASKTMIKAGTTVETPVIEKEIIINSQGGEAVIGKQ